MDFAHYADDAAGLVNAPLGSLGDLRRWLGERAWLAETVTDDDLGVLVAVQAELAAVVDVAARRDGAAVVGRLNQLLDRHPMRPRISGHDATTWHLHVSGTGAPAAEVIVTEALFGLTLLVTELGPDRLGRCAATGCTNAFVDTSTNRSRRFCSTRCATRTNVANHRRRRQAATG
jgi:predicted RNA-binding Zn ribbon-like protein